MLLLLFITFHSHDIAALPVTLPVKEQFHPEDLNLCVPTANGTSALPQTDSPPVPVHPPPSGAHLEPGRKTEEVSPVHGCCSIAVLELPGA